MRRILAGAVIFTLGCVGVLPGQLRTRSTSSGKATPAIDKAPSATMHGTLHRVTSKEVVIVNAQGDLVSFARTHKTKFLSNGKEIKPNAIAQGSVMSVDVHLAPDMTPEAVNVMVDSPPIDGAAAPAVKTSSSPGQMDSEEPAGASTDPAKPAPKPEGPPSR